MGDEDVICNECGSEVHRSEAEYTGDSEEAEWTCSACQDAAELAWFREREPKLQAALDNMAPRVPELDQFRKKG